MRVSFVFKSSLRSRRVMDALKQAACDAIDQSDEDLHRLSNTIWNLKELSFQEHQSHAALTQFLEDRSFQVERHHKMETAFVATYQRKDKKCDGPNISVLCEYDALPDIGHACGHNLIAEIGAGAAIGIKAALEKSGRDLGQLTVVGTPAEEGGGGKIELLNAGVFDNVDVAMMSHPAPFTDARPIFLGGKRFVANFHGRASHAAGFPWEGVNALDAAVLAYMNVSALRQQMKPLWRAHAIIPKGGTRTNIIPDEAQLGLQVRAPIDSEVTTLETRVKDCVRAAAAATGCSVDIVDGKNPYTCLITNETLARLYETNAKQVGVSFPSGTNEAKQILGSTDMGNLSHAVPCLHPTYDICTKSFNHTYEFATATGSPDAQAPTLSQAKALAMVAIDIYQQPELLQTIKQDFEKDLKHM